MMTETLGQRPTYRFDEMAIQVKDKIDNPAEADVDRYVGLEHIDPESLKIRRWGETTDVESSKIVFKSGDIIFGKRRAYQRKLAVADFDGICSAHAMVLRPKTDVVLEEFLPFFMQSDIFMDRAVKISVGGLSPTINWGDLAKEEFALPPLEEQRRIAEVLQAWSSLEDKLKQCLSSLDTCKKSLLDEFFDPVAARRAISSGRRPHGSGWVNLGQIAPLQAGYAFKSDDYSEAGDRLLRGSNVAVDGTSWDPRETRFWPVERRDEFADFILDEDDVVIAMDRPFIGSGFKVARLTEDDLPALLLQRVGRFQAEDRASRDLVWAFVHSRSFHLQLLAQQEGTDLPHISKAQIENTLVPAASCTKNNRFASFAELWKQGRSIHRRIQSCVGARRAILERALQ